MSTVYDFVTVFIFIILVGMFLHFSGRSNQQLGPYILPALGCAVANYLGNEGWAMSAWLIIFGTLAYIYGVILRPGGVGDDEML